MAKSVKTSGDLVTSFRIFLNGKPLSGVEFFGVNVDICDESLLTKIVLRMAIKKNSLRQYKHNGYRVFSFHTLNYSDTASQFHKINKHKIQLKTKSDCTHNDIVVMNEKFLKKVIDFSIGIKPASRTVVNLVMALNWGGFKVKTESTGRKSVYLETE